MIGYATYTFRHRGSDFWIRATETTTSRYCITALVWTLRHAAVAAESGGVYVQASADKCRLKMRLPTLRNELIINAVHVKSVGCRQIARLKK